MRFAKTRFTSLFLILLVFVSKAQNDKGLLFRSYQAPIASRTSLHLSPDAPLEFKDILSVSFDISLWRMTELGYILRFSSVDLSNRIDLLYKPGETGKGVFKVSINGQEEGVQLQVQAHRLVRNNWLNMTVQLDKRNQKLSLSIDKETASFNNPLLSSITSLNSVFGKSPYSLPSSVATPRFGIKNLKLQKGETEYTWPLSKHDQPILASENLDYRIKVEYPEWVIDKHQNWQLQHFQQAKPMPGIAFDNTKDEVYVVEESLISIYNLTNGVKSEFNPKNSFPKDQGTQYALYSTQQRKLYGYDLGPEKGYVFNKDTETWENSSNEEGPPIHVWQHASFENTLNGNPMIFGGYGFFTARNTLLELNPETQQWSTIPLKGEIPEPRFMLGITQGFNQGEYYVYGGYGNTSGKQDLGYENLSDLYLLNINDSTIKKLWGLAPGTTPYLPSTTMVLHSEDSSIYAIGHDYLGGTKELELLKIDIAKPQIEVIKLEQKLPFEIRNIGDYSLFLYYASQTKELVSVLRINTDPNNAEVKIHTISYPPYASPLSAEVAHAKTPWEFMIPGATLLIGLLFLVIRSMQNTSKDHSKKGVITSQAVTNYEVTLLGEFDITNKEGNALTTKLSPKLKELFLLITLHSLSDKKGISTHKLTETLWPDATSASGKNNRGVNLQKLRQLLKDIHTLEISFKENRWVISFESTQDCDLYHMLNAIEENDLSAVLALAPKGKLLPATSYEWLDTFKVDVHFKIIQFLMSKCKVAKKQEDWEQLIDISRAMMNIDPVNDEALQFILQALISLKKVGNAKTIYEQFAKRYKNLYGEAYPVEFSDILK